MTKASFSIVLALALVSTSPAGAQPVSHYSFTVNNGGSSGECMTCHSDTIAGHVASCTVQCSYRDPHIIDTPYPPTENIDAYRPPEEVVAAGVRLPAGLVTCISCHDLRNPPPYHLAVPKEGSMLCFVCHIM